MRKCSAQSQMNSLLGWQYAVCIVGEFLHLTDRILLFPSSILHLLYSPFQYIGFFPRGQYVLFPYPLYYTFGIKPIS